MVPRKEGQREEYEPMMTSSDLPSSYARNEQCGSSTRSGSICTREHWERDQLTRLSEVGQTLQDHLVTRRLQEKVMVSQGTAALRTRRSFDETSCFDKEASCDLRDELAAFDKSDGGS